MEVNGQLHAPTALPPGKQPLHPMNWRMGGSITKILLCTIFS